MLSARPVAPLSAFDFLSRDQLSAYVEARRDNAARREAAKGPEGAGLVSIKTSRSPLPFARRKPEFVAQPQCETGIPQRHEYTSMLPARFYPDPDAMEIDQALMRLRRLKKNVLMSARFHEKESKPQRSKPLMVTLTYRDTVDWDGKQISRYLSAVKNWQARQRPGLPFRYVWVFELTKRGRPHYHVLIWLPRGLTMPKADKRGWWPHGMTRTEWARHAVGYLAKYASKGTDDVLPKGVRLYGVGGLTAKSRCVRAWWNLPVGVRRWGEPRALWRRAPGGGWVSRRDGEWRPSAWRVVLLPGRVYVLPRVQSIASPFDALLQALSGRLRHIGL